MKKSIFEEYALRFADNNRSPFGAVHDFTVWTGTPETIIAAHLDTLEFYVCPQARIRGGAPYWNGGSFIATVGATSVRSSGRQLDTSESRFDQAIVENKTWRIRHGKDELSVAIPPPLLTSALAVNPVMWDKGVLLVEDAHQDAIYKVAFRSRPVRFSRLPNISLAGHCPPIGLVDGSIVLSFQIARTVRNGLMVFKNFVSGEYEEQNRNPNITYIYSPTTQSWESYPGLYVLASSWDGRYVGYVVGQENKMRVAKIDP